MSNSKKFEITEEALDSFIETERVVFASGENKRFYVALKNRPMKFWIQNMKTKQEFGLTDKKIAVEQFNKLVV